MTGFRLYLEFPTATAKRKSGRDNQGHEGTVFAAYTDRPYRRIDHGRYVNDGVGAVFAEPNSPVASCAANVDEWLRKKCKRIPESLARQIHPALFAYLDSHEVSA